MTKTCAEYQQDTAMDVYPGRMTARHAREARDIGEGNYSEGLRQAVELAHFLKKTNAPAWVEWVKGRVKRRRA